MPTPEDAPTLEKWLTATEVADRLGVSRQSVNRMIQGGAFKTLHLLGERPIYVVKTAEVEEHASKRAARRTSA